MFIALRHPQIGFVETPAFAIREWLNRKTERYVRYFLIFACISKSTWFRYFVFSGNNKLFFQPQNNMLSQVSLHGQRSFNNWLINHQLSIEPSKRWQPIKKIGQPNEQPIKKGKLHPWKNGGNPSPWQIITSTMATQLQGQRPGPSSELWSLATKLLQGEVPGGWPPCFGCGGWDELQENGTWNHGMVVCDVFC